jgi:hypothetical protein
MLSEKYDDLDPWHTFIQKEMDEVALLNFHDFDTFCSIDSLLSAKFTQ